MLSGHAPADPKPDIVTAQADCASPPHFDIWTQAAAMLRIANKTLGLVILALVVFCSSLSQAGMCCDISLGGGLVHAALC